MNGEFQRIRALMFVTVCSSVGGPKNYRSNKRLKDCIDVTDTEIFNTVPILRQFARTDSLYCLQSMCFLILMSITFQIYEGKIDVFNLGNYQCTIRSIGQTDLNVVCIVCTMSTGIILSESQVDTDSFERSLILMIGTVQIYNIKK